tara:strand:- start:324 stop:884 length:561 start_codon:yes stop_codon:yes gene_type:complete
MSEINPSETTYPPLRHEFKCPIGHNIMKDPVIAADGHIYDRRNIYNWFIQSNTTRSPMTNVAMDSKTVFPVIYLQSQIKEWIESIKNKPIPDDIKELVDFYYESVEDSLEEDVEQILSDMTNQHNNDLQMSIGQTDNEWPPNIDLFPQETDAAILDEIERMMTANQINVMQSEMFEMFNSSEPTRT